VKDNQPTVGAYLVDQPWNYDKPDAVSDDRGHGRLEKRSLWVLPVDREKPIPGFPTATQMIQVLRETSALDGTKPRSEVAFAITSRDAAHADPQDLQEFTRGHWCIENRCHWVRDVTFDEDRSRVRTGSGPQVMASLRNLAISVLRLSGAKNIAAATRSCSYDNTLPFRLLRFRVPAARAA
jgi:Transposase DDE domain